MLHQRQEANALAGDLEDGVTHCRPNGGDTRLANAAPFVAAGERQVCLHLGHLMHTEHLVGVKVAFYRTTLFNGDLAIEGVREAIDNATFHLLRRALHAVLDPELGKSVWHMA